MKNKFKKMNIKGILSHARNLINYMEPLNEKKNFK